MGRNDYKIQFAGLSLGEHEFEFNIDAKFFEALDYSEIKKGKIKVNVNLLKQSGMMILHFNIAGTVEVPCDRCTEEFDFKFEGNNKLIVKVSGDDLSNENDDIITIAPNEHELELKQYLYEYIILSLPIKKIHPDNKKGESTCNKVVLDKLKKYLIENDENTEIDPRWNQLKDINFN